MGEAPYRCSEAPEAKKRVVVPGYWSFRAEVKCLACANPSVKRVLCTGCDLQVQAGAANVVGKFPWKHLVPPHPQHFHVLCDVCGALGFESTKAEVQHMALAEKQWRGARLRWLVPTAIGGGGALVVAIIELLRMLP